MSNYWDGNGTYQTVYEQLKALVPVSGSVNRPYSNKALERMRIAANCYYDLYNNGLCNRARQFAKIFKMSSVPYRSDYWNHTTYSEVLDAKMDAIILAAAEEQNIST